MRQRKRGDEDDPESRKTLVKVYNLILTFDTNVPNSSLSDEIENIIKKVNLILSKEMKDSLPHFFKDVGKEPKISIVYNIDDD